MKTIFEKRLENYSNKSYLAKEVWKTYNDIFYAIKRWPQLKPELKNLYFNWMVEIWVIKKDK